MSNPTSAVLLRVPGFIWLFYRSSVRVRKLVRTPERRLAAPLWEILIPCCPFPSYCFASYQGIHYLPAQRGLLCPLAMSITSPSSSLMGTTTIDSILQLASDSPVRTALS